MTTKMKTAFLVLGCGTHIVKEGTGDMTYADFRDAFAAQVLKVIGYRGTKPRFMTIANGTEVLHYAEANEIFAVLQIKLGIVERSKDGERTYIAEGIGRGRLEFSSFNEAHDEVLRLQVRSAGNGNGSTFEIKPLEFPETQFGSKRYQPAPAPSATIDDKKILGRFAIGGACCEDGVGEVLVLSIGPNLYRVQIRAGTLPDGSEHQDFAAARLAFKYAMTIVETLVSDECLDLEG